MHAKHGGIEIYWHCIYIEGYTVCCLVRNIAVQFGCCVDERGWYIRRARLAGTPGEAGIQGQQGTIAPPAPFSPLYPLLCHSPWYQH